MRFFLGSIVSSTLFSLNLTAQVTPPSQCPLPPNLSGIYNATCELLVTQPDNQILTGSAEFVQIMQSQSDPCKVYLDAKISSSGEDIPYAKVGSFTSNASPDLGVTRTDFDELNQTLEIVSATRIGDGVRLTLSKLTLKNGLPQTLVSDITTKPDETVVHEICEIGEKVKP